MKTIVKVISIVSFCAVLSLGACNSSTNTETGTLDSPSEIEADTMAVDSIGTDTL